MMSQIITELPMHLLVFACGAFGYLATRWINDCIYPRIAREFQDDLQTEDEKFSKAMQKDEAVDVSTAVAGTPSLSMEPKLSPCFTEIRRVVLESGGLEGGVEFLPGGVDSNVGTIREKDGMSDRAVQVRKNGEQPRIHIE